MSTSGGGQSTSPYPAAATPVAASSGPVANAAATATLPAVAARTNFLSGFTVTPGTATGAAQVVVTVTGVVGGPLSYSVEVPSAAGGGGQTLSVSFNPPLPATAVNVAIVVSMPAAGVGGAGAAVNATGYLI